MDGRSQGATGKDAADPREGLEGQIRAPNQPGDLLLLDLGVHHLPRAASPPGPHSGAKVPGGL